MILLGDLNTAPFGSGHVFELIGETMVIQHKSEVALTWGDLLRIVSDEKSNNPGEFTGSLVGISDEPISVLILE